MFPKQNCRITNLKTKNKSRSKFFRSKFLIYSHQPPTHKWNIEIPEPISAEVKCSGRVYNHLERGGYQNVNVDLKWELDLNDGDKRVLMKDRSITKKAKVTIEQDGDNWDWWVTTEKLGPSQLWVSTGKGSGSLSITVQYTVANGSHQGHTGKISLSCDSGGSMNSRWARGERVYSLNTRASSEGRYDKVNVGGELNIGVSLKDCQRVEEGQIECSLNVVTNNP